MKKLATFLVLFLGIMLTNCNTPTSQPLRAVFSSIVVPSLTKDMLNTREAEISASLTANFNKQTQTAAAAYTSIAKVNQTFALRDTQHSFTRTPTRTKSVAEQQTIVAGYDPTQRMLETLSPFLSLCPSISDLRLSPRGGWVIEDCYPQPIRVTSFDRKITYIIRSDKQYYDGTEGTYWFTRWSNDDRYFYYTLSFNWDGPDRVFYSGNALLRFDLLTGESAEVLHLTSEIFKYYSISFSPSGNYLAYIVSPSKIMNIVNMTTGEVKHINLSVPECGSGRMMWSPDEDKILYIASKRNGTDFCDYYYSVAMVDLGSYKDVELISNSEGYIIPQDWVGENPTLYFSYGNSGYFTLNINTKELTPYNPD